MQTCLQLFCCPQQDKLSVQGSWMNGQIEEAQIGNGEEKRKMVFIKL